MRFMESIGGIQDMDKTILEMKNITKSFPGVKALDNVNFKVVEGEIHALVGENGAGKSTLMNVLSGVHAHGSYSGEIIFNGKECKFNRIRDSEHLGIVVIQQELELVPTLSIAENVFLGNERSKMGIIDWDETRVETRKLLDRVRLKDDPSLLVKDIGVGKQQLVEIAKAISKKVKLLVLDEPTAALNEEESENLLNLLKELQTQGLTSIMISHKLREVAKIADQITILRDGTTIETLKKGKDDISEDRIIKGMVGREMTDRFPKRVSHIGGVTFEIKNWNVFDPLVEGRQIIKNASISIRKGEVVGIAGLMGAGRTEFAMSVFGKAYGKHITGKAFKDGKEIHLHSIRQAIKEGVAYTTEDRKSAGLILINDIMFNITLAGLKKISKASVINNNEEIIVAEEYRKKLNIKSTGITQKAGNLSGGNQQKLVLSKWTFVQPDILILDEPTRGIDVGAKYEIYSIINNLVAEGKSVIFISSELPELLGMCDRIYVMNEGQIVGEFDKKEATQENIMKSIMNNEAQEVS